MAVAGLRPSRTERGPMSARRVRPSGRWIRAALPALAAGILTASLTVPAVAGTGPTTVNNGQRTVSVSPASGIPDGPASIVVTGSGFSGKGDLWVAICQDKTGAPQQLNGCLGGPIPGKNVSKAWVTVTDNPDLAASGLNVAKWRGTGFSATLQLTTAADNNADCITGKCSIYVRSSEGGGDGQRVTVPIAFQPVAGSSSSSSSASSTSSAGSSTTASTTASPSSAASTIATSTTASTTASTVTSSTASSTRPVPTTVPAQSILLGSVQQGRDEVAVFGGFLPGEAVSATISGNPPVKLTVPAASANGSVRVAWTVPANFPVAGYSLRVEGAKSLRVGVANFTVVAAPVVSSPAGSSTVAASSTAPSVTSSAVSSTASSTSAPSTSFVDSSTTAAPTTTSSLAAPAPANTSSKTPWWLWITLAVVVLVALVVGAVSFGRRHKQDAEADRRSAEAELAAAAGDEQARQQQATIIANQPPRDPIHPSAPGEYDEHPDRPILFSHRQAEHYSPPTDPIDGGEAPTQAIGDPGQAGPPPPPGQQSPPPDEPGPGTQTFDALADDPDTDDQGRGQWQPPSR